MRWRLSTGLVPFGSLRLNASAWLLLRFASVWPSALRLSITFAAKQPRLRHEQRAARVACSQYRFACAFATINHTDRVRAGSAVERAEPGERHSSPQQPTPALLRAGSFPGGSRSGG